MENLEKLMRSYAPYMSEEYQAARLKIAEDIVEKENKKAAKGAASCQQSFNYRSLSSSTETTTQGVYQK